MKIQLEEILIKNNRLQSTKCDEEWFKTNHEKLYNEIKEKSKFLIGMDFKTILLICLYDKLYIPNCNTCKQPHLKWQKQKKDWSKYCSMKCCQNDPEVKERMLVGQQKVNWGSAISKRETTMISTYGVIAASQLQKNKQKIAEASKEYWAETSNVKHAKEKRAKTNKQKYGVEHLSMNAEYHSGRMKTASETRNNKTEEEKKEIIEKYRRSRLGEKKYSYITNKDWLLENYSAGKRLAEVGHIIGVHPCVIEFSLEKNQIGIDWDRERTNRSLLEIEFFNFIKSISPDAIHTYRFGKTLHNLDVFIPSSNIGFEFNGVFWHSELKKDRDFHSEKMKMVNNCGIRLIQIWEDDWNNKKDVIKKFINNILCINSIRIGARKTSVVELTNTEFSNFMDNNHIQGSTTSGIKLGLMKDGEILSAIGLTEIGKGTKEYELRRFANTNVTGAFQKLLSFFEKKYNPSLIKTFGDLEIVDRNNNIYVNNGFTEDLIIDIDYRYYNPRSKKREHKFNWRKKNFQNLGIDISHKDERMLALEYGLLRCYDSGKIRYIKKY